MRGRFLKHRKHRGAPEPEPAPAAKPTTRITRLARRAQRAAVGVRRSTAARAAATRSLAPRSRRCSVAACRPPKALRRRRRASRRRSPRNRRNRRRTCPPWPRRRPRPSAPSPSNSRPSASSASSARPQNLRARCISPAHACRGAVDGSTAGSDGATREPRAVAGGRTSGASRPSVKHRSPASNRRRPYRFEPFARESRSLRSSLRRVTGSGTSLAWCELVICVTRIKGQLAAVNPDLIETVESNPDTTICFVSGEKLLVQETLEEIVERVHDWPAQPDRKLLDQPRTPHHRLAPPEELRWTRRQ